VLTASPINTAIRKPVISREITLYPNPAVDVINIKSSAMITYFELYDMMGHRLMMQKNPQSVISVSDLQSGMYIVKITSRDGSVKTEKLLKR